MKERSADEAAPIYFGEKLASSQAFAGLFRDGMALVEETASYLDGPGRQDSKGLERNAALAYATESMRLTTRLMQLASWLLLHKLHLSDTRNDLFLARASVLFLPLGFFIVAFSPTVAGATAGFVISTLGTGYGNIIRSLVTSMVAHGCGSNTL